MTKLITSEGGDDGSKDSESRADGGEQSHGEAGRNRKKRIPDADDCLAALAQLPGLVAMGLIKPAQANAIRATYSEILRQHQRSESRDDRKGIANDDVMELMRRDPKIFSILEPLLTDEQIDLVMQGGPDGNHEQA